MREVAVVVMLVAVGLSGCFGGNEDAGDPSSAGARPAGAVSHGEDPLGDARYGDREYYVGKGGQICRAAARGTPTLACYTTVGAAGEILPSGAGEAAPPEHDVVGIRLTETPDHLLMDLELAHVAPDLAGILGPEEVGALVVLCLSDCDAGVVNVQVLPGPDGRPVIARDTAIFGFFDEACGGYGFCGWRVDAEVLPGEPGAIRAHVPRELLPVDEPGTTFRDVRGAMMTGTLWEGPPMAFELAAEGPAGGGVASWSGMAPYATSYQVDRAEGAPLTLELTGSGEDVPRHTDLTDPVADVVDVEWRPRDAPAYDILEARLVENATHLSMEADLGQVDADVDPAWVFYASLDVMDGPTYNVYGWREEGRVASEVWAIADPNWSEAWEVPVEMTVATGTPGTIRFTFERADLDGIVAGERVGMFFLQVQRDEAPPDQLSGTNVIRVGYDPDVERAMDFWRAPPLRFEMGEVAS